MNSVEKKKRERAVNFTELEIRFLVDIAIRHIHIIENKKTDAVSWKDKNQAWEKIANDFNALTGSVNRPAKVLRLKYDGLKRSIKSKQSKNKLEIFKTGGGSPNPDPLTDYEEKLLGYICLSVDGLPSENDSDFLLEPLPSCSTEANQEPEGLDCILAEILVNENGDNFTTNEADESHCLTIQDNAVGGCSENSKLKWKNWNPKQLKEKRHTALFSSAPKKPLNKDTLNRKIDLLTDSRSELVQLQAQIAEQEIRQKEKQSEAQTQFLKNQEDRQHEQHQQLMTNLKLQHLLLMETQERQKREGILREQLLLLDIDNKKLDILIKKKQLQ